MQQIRPSDSASTSLPTISTTTARHMTPDVDPSLEAESLTVMAHLALDFSGFVISPSRSLFRLAAVLGRVCAISADYVLDHNIHTEELMIQLFLISVAMKDFFFPANVPGNSTAETK
ncbi:MAG: hypothetical protein SGARI_005023 [Bacillariaceae sp.]